MFKIESYITSIILANADKYIKNFRKQDAQVSLWEGDATFHNIDLNVDALNDELQSSLTFTSGYIHDLTIHVPWTKLMSEPVTISVNTIECVVRLKSKDEMRTMSPGEKVSTTLNTEYADKIEKRSQDEIHSQSSYTSAITSKIMNNLCISCENVILKLVEEDIVFSMNIEKLRFENVNEDWVQSITDVNMGRLITRKLITLSGVTICLDKQSSSGRIDTYLEPLLYRCLVTIRLLRAYNRSVSKKPIYTHFDILSDKMFFTVSEPQIPMLLKLGFMVFHSHESQSSNSSKRASVSPEQNFSNSDSVDFVENTNENNENTSWGNWLWNMVPAILPQEDEMSQYNKQTEFSSILHIGFFIKCLETNLKCLNQRSKKNPKPDFENLVKGTFTGCFYQMTLKNSEWFNVQFGVNHVSLETLYPGKENANQIKQFFNSGAESDSDFMKDTLFDAKKTFPFETRVPDVLLVTTDNVLSEPIFSEFDFTSELSVDTHLNLYTEHTLLEKTTAFAIDYLKTCQIVVNENELSMEESNDDSDYFEDETKLSRKIEKNFLLRFVFGSSVLRLSSDVLGRIDYLLKIVPYREYLNLNTTAEVTIRSELENRSLKYTTNYITQFTFFDFAFEVHPLPASNLKKLTSSIPETTFSDKCPVLNLRLKCVDGNIITARNAPPAVNGVEPSKKIISLTAVDISSSMLKQNQVCNLLKLEKLSVESSLYLSNACRETRLETKNLKIMASKCDLLLVECIVNYVTSSIYRQEQNMNYFTKIFYSSLIEDSLVSDKPVLEVEVGNAVCRYTYLEKTSNINVVINGCKMYANRLKEDIMKKTLIFSTAELVSESSDICVMIQRCTNCNERCSYPSGIWLNIRNLKINLDTILYSWLLYQPANVLPDKVCTPVTQSPKENTTVNNKSVPSRKISDCSSGSHGRRFGANYPKPKESVHSSSEPEILSSPPVITETESSDIFILPTVICGAPAKEKLTVNQYLTDHFESWRNFIVHCDVSEVMVYFPTESTLYENELENVEYIIKEVFRNSGDSRRGIFVLSLKSLRIKCDVPLNMSDVAGTSLVSVSKDMWSFSKLTFPWNISLNEMSFGTLLEVGACKSLLKPLSADCTIGVSIKEGKNNGSVIALCVHSNFQPICFTLTNKQIILITEVMETLRAFYTSTKESNTSLSYTVGVESKLPAQGQLAPVTGGRKQNHLTGWIQCTFTKCSINLYSMETVKHKKLCIEAEDSIMSVEFDDVFHKMKLKIASFGVHHYQRSKGEAWRSGPFHGFVIQRCYAKSVNSHCKMEDDNDDRFSVITVTRARSSNLKTRLLQSQTSADLASYDYEDNFVTEIIVKICPVDIVLPLTTIEVFFTILEPFKGLYSKEVSTQPASEMVTNELTGSALPLLYFDMPMFRVFVPSSASGEMEQNAVCDTFICEVGSIRVDCHLENPANRKQLYPEIYYRVPAKRYSTMEQKLQSQQYQVHFSDVSVNTGIWTEIEEMLAKEQLSVEEPPSAFEQNPAVMWNQGCHPHTKNKINLNHLLPVVSKFSCQAVIAPPLESSYSLKTVVHSAYYELNVVSDLNTTISTLQVSLLMSLYKDYVKCVSPYLTTVKKDHNTVMAPLKLNNGQSKLTDSGIESMDQSSVESFSVFKAKPDLQSTQIHQGNSKPVNSAYVSNMSTLHQSRSIFRHENLKEIYVTTQNIRFTLYKTSIVDENNEAKTVYNGLIFAEIMQPYILLNYENNYSSLQFSVFSATIKIPNLRNSNQFAEIPTIKAFPKVIVDVKKTKCDPYSKIKYPCLDIKTFNNVNPKQKIEVFFGQTILLDADVDVIEYILRTSALCRQEFKEYIQQFENVNNKRDQCVQTTDQNVKFDSFKNRLDKLSNMNLSTNRIAVVFRHGAKCRNMLLNVDGMNVKTCTPSNIRNPADSISIQWSLKSVTLSVPETCSPLSDLFTDDKVANRRDDILWNLILKPWNLNLELLLIWNRWSLFEEVPWKCVKVYSENVVVDVNPSYLRCVSALSAEYAKLAKDCFRANGQNVGNSDEMVTQSRNKSNVESYTDDLRAGAFQYIKNENTAFELPSPYEVIFCNRQIQPYMSWRYPQPRNLIRLQIYPVPVEDMNEDYIEEEVYCQLQYYDEIRCVFLPYVSFKLSENTIQNVSLPNKKSCTIAAECWRIILYDNVDLQENYNNYRIDVRSLAGCVRVDSVFDETLISGQHLFVNVSEIQVNFATISQADNVQIEHYTLDYTPSKQDFLSVVCNELKVTATKYEAERYAVELCGTNKASILNYEYLMFQSFVDPFSFNVNLYLEKDLTPKLTGLVKSVQLRVSPNFIHTLTVSWELWNEWSSASASGTQPWRITAPYIVCNSTNHVITFRQDETSESVHLFPFSCHLYSWYNPAASKMLKFRVFLDKNYSSEPVNIKKKGCMDVKCEKEEGTESAHLFVSVIKHSSVVNQVIVYGNLMLYNLTNADLDMCVISHGKRDSKFSSSQMLNGTTVVKSQLLSVLVPDHHKLSFKVRYAAISATQNEEHSHWSGLIPLVALQQYSSQDSWMVKIPLKNHKEHFQSVWCQVTKEITENAPKYLVVFRPLCSVTSLLPWKSEVKILNEVGAAVSTEYVSDKGTSTDLFIPDTVNLDKYTIEWKPDEETKKYVSKITIEKATKRNSASTNEWSVQTMVEEIMSETENNQWPFLKEEYSKFNWKTDRVYDIVPIIKVERKEDNGCGTRIEIHPWALIVNILSFRVLLDISDTIYQIESYEIVAPPCIEGTFKLGLADGGKDYLSGILQLSDDQSFPIPKVTGRIPMNGFVTTMIDCDEYVTFMNIASKNYREMRVISMCSSYVISNGSSFSISCAALVVCRTGNRSSFSFDIPSDLAPMAISLPPKQSSNVAQPITKWYKIGKGDVQVLPYLVLSVNGNVGCPVRICDLSEKLRYSIIFSSSNVGASPLPCIFITAQQNEGQVFLTIWEEKVPQIIVHNMSQLSLDVISSKSDQASDDISYCPDWNWKFTVNTMSTAHFHIHQQMCGKNSNKIMYYLKFSVKNSKPVKQTKWSSGVPLKPCINQLITLPLSQHHIKLAMFKDGFTYIVWIESATSDELSAKMIRTRLSESFLPLNGKSTVLHTESASNQTEDSNEIPAKLQNLYNFGKIRPYETNILIQQISIIAACDNDITFEEEDIATFCGESVIVHLKTSQKPNEVNEDIQLYIDIGNYQVNNEQFHLRTFDFPIVLLSKSSDICENIMGRTPRLEDLLISFTENEFSALKVILNFKNNKSQILDVRDVMLHLNSLNVFLEDKYLTKLKLVLKDIFSSVLHPSTPKSTIGLSDTGRKPVNHDVLEHSSTNALTIPHTDKTPSKAKSSSSKSVNVSIKSGDLDDKSFTSVSVVESGSLNEDCMINITAGGFDYVADDPECEPGTGSYNESQNYVMVPGTVVRLSRMIARPLRLRSMSVSGFKAVVSLHTSTTFYVALDRSPLNFSEFRKDYLVTTPFELGNLIFVHYFFGAIYGTGWAISSLEFVGSPGVLARTLGTGIKDFVSLPLYGIASGPRGFVLGVAHGSASLMKHVLEGTLSSVTKFAGSWARTLDRFTLDGDDLLQSEEIRRFPPSNIAEGVLQGLTEFGISILGGISGIAHHPLQYYALSNDGNRSLINSISLGIVGVITRPLSGAAELVARTGQGILSHVGWNTLPMVRIRLTGACGCALSKYPNAIKMDELEVNCPLRIRSNSNPEKNFSHLQLSTLKYQWKRETDEVLFALEAVSAQNIAVPLWITLTSRYLKVTEMFQDERITVFSLQTHEFTDNENDPTSVAVLKPTLNYKNAEDFCKARILRFINEANRYCNLETNLPAPAEEASQCSDRMETVFTFCVNPQTKVFLLTMISFIKNMFE